VQAHQFLFLVLHPKHEVRFCAFTTKDEFILQNLKVQNEHLDKWQVILEAIFLKKTLLKCEEKIWKFKTGGIIYSAFYATSVALYMENRCDCINFLCDKHYRKSFFL
jgi:hypothetical protein